MKSSVVIEPSIGVMKNIVFLPTSILYGTLKFADLPENSITMSELFLRYAHSPAEG